LLGRGVLLTIAIAVLGFASSAQALEFTTPQQLPKWAGGEPSLAFDPNGNGNMYVTAPQSIPSAAGALVGAPADKGVGFWGSHDGGLTFPEVLNTGTGTGGGDSDVEVATDGTVFVADLEAAAAAICTSKDHGHSFPDCEPPFAKNQQGPENDREWLTRGMMPDLARLRADEDRRAERDPAHQCPQVLGVGVEAAGG